MVIKKFAITEKQIKMATIVLGGVGVLLVGIILFNVFKDQIVGASNTAPSNVTITNITQNGAKIKWNTDRETQSVVEYGTSPTSLTFFAPESTKTKDHEVELSLLTPETTYYFQIATGDKRFSNGGVPWTFTTQGKDAAAKGTQSATPSAQLSPTVANLSPAPTSVLPATSATPTPVVVTTTGPTATPTPFAQGTPVARDTTCALSEYTAAVSGYQAKYDQDYNGVINSRDYYLCLSLKPTAAPTATATPTITP